jgi:hypothetical protein
MKSKFKTFSEQIINKRTKKEQVCKALESKVYTDDHGTYTSRKDQSYIVSLLKQGFKYNVPVIISTDNKTDQNEHQRPYSKMIYGRQM